MYLSTLQKHILILAKKNMIDENLSLNSDAFENSIITYSNLKKANSIIKKMENGSIKVYISLKTKLDKLKVKYPFGPFGSNCNIPKKVMGFNKGVFLLLVDPGFENI